MMSLSLKSTRVSEVFDGFNFLSLVFLNRGRNQSLQDLNIQSVKNRGHGTMAWSCHAVAKEKRLPVHFAFLYNAVFIF